MRCGMRELTAPTMLVLERTLKGWEENKDKIPKGSLIFASMEEVEKLKIKEEREKDGKPNGWRVFFTLATFTCTPLIAKP